MPNPLVYFVRHGETDWNAEHRLQGQADRDITALGREQAIGNGKKLAGLIADPSQFDFVASPLLRTRHTMELLRGAMGLDPADYRMDARLMELNFGDWQGRTYADLERDEPGVAEIRESDKWHFLPPGLDAESYALLEARIEPWLREVTEQTVCVCHGGVIRSLFAIIANVDRAEAGNLGIPQDKVLKWQDGVLDWI